MIFLPVRGRMLSFFLNKSSLIDYSWITLLERLVFLSTVVEKKSIKVLPGLFNIALKLISIKHEIIDLFPYSP